MNLFVLGLGYSGSVLARRKLAEGWRVLGTVRSPEKMEALRAEGIEAFLFDAHTDELENFAMALRETDALLISIPPVGQGDTLAEKLSRIIFGGAGRPRWIGYLSTIGVYGDHAGAFVDETMPCRPSSMRSRARCEAEKSWMQLGSQLDIPVIIFRLPGIYGPGRNAFAALRKGTARRIVKPGQIFNRVHVDDIAAALSLSMKKDIASAIYNVTDDEPSPPQDVIAFAAALLGMEPPPEIDFAEAELSPMAASFYGESKRVRNDLIKRRIDFAPQFPSYREGLEALLRAGE
ncbi:MAG: SDR family oxidoreductase [Hyphomicrobiales bacterium]|nr:SDR family oxidoreductase [Hyphomicrobiales bacterium]